MSKIQIAGEDLQFEAVPYHVPAPLTGELVARLAKTKKPKACVVIQLLDDSSLRALQPHEKAQSSNGPDLRFIVFEGSSIYHFEVDSQKFIWGASRIRGDVVKKLIGVDPIQYGVWQESNEAEDKQIDNDKFAQLDSKNLIAFFTAKRESTEGASL